MDEPVIIADAREQNPFEFNGPTRKGSLKTGDYSIDGFEDQVAIERKSLDDLIQCLGRQRARFERELLRARELQYSAVIIEAPYSAFAAGLYRSRLNPHSAVESISAFEIRYQVPFLFCGNRVLAARKTESLLRKFWRENSERKL